MIIFRGIDKLKEKERKWLCLFLWHISNCRLLMPNPFLNILRVLFQTIQVSISA